MPARISTSEPRAAPVVTARRSMVSPFNDENILRRIVLANSLLRHQTRRPAIFPAWFLAFGSFFEERDLHTHVGKDARVFGGIKQLLVIGLGERDAHFDGGLLAIRRGNHGADFAREWSSRDRRRERR